MLCTLRNLYQCTYSTAPHFTELKTYLWTAPHQDVTLTTTPQIKEIIGHKLPIISNAFTAQSLFDTASPCYARSVDIPPPESLLPLGWDYTLLEITTKTSREDQHLYKPRGSLGRPEASQTHQPTHEKNTYLQRGTYTFRGYSDPGFAHERISDQLLSAINTTI